MRQIEGRLEAELLRIVQLRAPSEAVGLILSDSRVIELPNHAEKPDHHFEAHKEDVLDVLQNENDLSEITFWHSHPTGGVGPSRTDLQNRTVFPHHLVVSLVDNGLIASWY